MPKKPKELFFMKNNFKVILAILFAIFSFLLYSRGLLESTPFVGDTARDLFDILQISLGDFRLIGPKLSFGGIYSAPWYYYLFVPVYLLFGKSFAAVLSFNALIHSLALAFVFLLLSRRWGSAKSVLFTAALMFLPLYVFSAKNPGNAFSYQPFLVLFLVWVFLKKHWESREVLLAGLAAGFIASFHVILLLIFFPAWVFLLLRKQFKEAALLIFGFVLPFAPLVLFELKHNFVMLKNTFLDQSYKMFTQNQNIPDREASPTNLVVNFFFINSQLASWTVLGPLVLMGVAFLANFREKVNLKWLGWGIISYLIFTFLSRYQFAIHYLLPLGLTILVLTLLILHKNRLFYLVLSVVMLVSIAKINLKQQSSTQNYQQVKKEVTQVIKSAEFAKESFNIVNVDQGGRSSTGNQYRYFFLLNGLNPLNEYQFTESKSLLVFADKSFNKQQLKRLNNYEIRQFGSTFLQKARVIETTGSRVFVLEK